MVLLAGCSAAGSLTMTDVDERPLAEQASRDADRLADRDAETGQVLERAIENGTATTTGTHPPVRDGLPLAHEGAYYDVSTTAAGTEPATRVGFRVDYDADPANLTGLRVAYEDLPAVDREALAGAVPPDDAVERRVEGFDLGGSAVYDASEADRSRLATDEREYVVVHDGAEYRLAVESVESTTLTTYRVSATEVAGSSAAYTDRLVDEHAFTLSGLNGSEREVVAGAIEGSYHAESTDDAAFRSIVERFRRHGAVRSDEYRGEYVVRYRGELYWAELRYGEFAEGEPAVAREFDPSAGSSTVRTRPVDRAS